MAKQKGYYVAALAGCSDPTVLLFFDGERMWTHGRNEPVDHKYLLFIDEQPFEHRVVKSENGTMQCADEWFDIAKNNELEGSSGPSLALHELKSTDYHYRAIGISTAHLSETDTLALDLLSSDKNCNMVFRRDTGWFIKLYCEPGSNDFDVSEELQWIIELCCKAGYGMIEFDCDATEFDNLPTYPKS